jgi:hypothetical protein
MTAPVTPCLHCERRPRADAYGLCAVCRDRPRVRVLYRRRRPGWTPEWEAHLIRLTERARKRLPLFDDTDATPPPS